MVDSHEQIVTGLITLAVLGLIVRRTLQTQTVRVWALVAVPLVLVVVAVGAVVAVPPASAAAAATIAAGAVTGAAIGYARGIHSTVKLGPRPGTLVIQGNVFLVIILVAAFAGRLLVRTFVGNTGMGTALADTFIVLAAVSVAVARGMLYFTWRRLVAAGRAVAI